MSFRFSTARPRASPLVEYATGTLLSVAGMKVGEHLRREDIFPVVVADLDEGCSRGQQPKIHPTFGYRPPDKVVTNPFRLEVHPYRRVDGQRVTAKNRNH